MTEKQNIQDATGSAVSIPERVDTLELIVCQCYFNQRVEIVGIVIINEIQHIDQEPL